MSLRDKTIKSEYRSLIDNVVQNFYIPLLNEASSYKRAVGYFSSSSLAEISKGIIPLAKKGIKGSIQIVASPNLSDEDLDAIYRGYEDRDEVIERSLLAELSTPDDMDPFSAERLNLLASLISSGVLDIKIAFTENEKGIGMYHEKMGLIEDEHNNVVAFSGSMNETSSGLSLNYETIDVFRNWGDSFESNQANLKVKAFEAIWENVDSGVQVRAFPNVTRTIVERYRKSIVDYEIDKIQFKTNIETSEKKENRQRGARIPEDVNLHDYQKDAIATWVGENYRGIFDMATGTGKTYTGLGAISKVSEDLNDNLAVIIVCPFQHLVEQWVEDIVKFNMKPIVGYSSSSQKDWKQRLSNAIRDQKIREDKKFFCFVCTNATFSSEYVQNQIEKIKSPILLVVDEAHNFGAQSYAQLLDDKYTYRLALSATLERYRDPEGTAALYQFFGKKCINYTLERAIKEDKLTPYKYYPVLVYLNEEELQSYEDISYELSKHVIKGKNGRIKLDSYGEILAIKRSRIVAGAIQKLDALIKTIEPYRHEHFILVYCGATNIVKKQSDQSETDEGDIRQIEAVTRLLGNTLDMKVSKFTAEENIETRASIKNHFKDGEDLQAIVAIKCLDEGVNIPGIKTAFILASTTNPKEYIQRRGRVLRKSPETGKKYAEIYDFVTLPRPLDEVASLTEDQMRRDLSLVKNEIARVVEFGRLSMNAMDANQLVWEICDCYHLPYDFYNSEEEINYGEL